jgi:hypothetical protein
MIPEWMTSLILGSILTLVASLVTLFVTYYINMKQKDRERVINQTENIIGSVYSPLLFLLSEVNIFLTDIQGSFGAFLKEGSFSKKSQNILMQFLKNTIKSFSSNQMRELLLGKIGFIKPIRFRRELFSYFLILREFENRLKDFIEDGFGNLEDNKKFIKCMEEAAIRLGNITQVYSGLVDKLIEQGKKEFHIQNMERYFPMKSIKR